MNYLKEFNEISKNDIINNVDDYFLEMQDSKKYNIKIVKSPSVIGNKLHSNNYREVTKNGSYVIRFEVRNNIDSIIEFLNEVNKVIKRWNLTNYFHRVKENKNKITFDLPIIRL